MAKRKPSTGTQATGESSSSEQSDTVRSSQAAQGKNAGEFMEVGQEVVPRDEAAVHLSRTYRNHRTHRLVPLRTIIASSSTDKTVRICPRHGRITLKALNTVPQGKRNGAAVKRHPGLTSPITRQP